MRVPRVPSSAYRPRRTNASPFALPRVAQQRLGTTARRLPRAALAVVAVHNQEGNGDVPGLRPTSPHDGDDGNVLLGCVPRGLGSTGVSNRPIFFL